jgi:SAM-dependent methyltransferase
MDVSRIQRDRLYGDLARLWPLVSAPEDYAGEAPNWTRTLRAKLGPGRHSLLELGAGGGHLLSHLTADFEATAVDISEGMLKNSVRLNPSVDHHLGDMRTVRLGRTFRAVIIHDAVDYMLTEDDLRAAFATAAAHLEPGGVLIVTPDHFRETFEDSRVTSETHSDGSTAVTFIEFDHDPDPSDTTIESIMIYIIREAGRTSLELDRHITGLFPLKTWLDLMGEAGFEVERHRMKLSTGPGSFEMLVGTRRPAP